MTTQQIPEWYIEELPPDTRQTPSRFAPEWGDAEWRQKWLGGFSDVDLDAMTPYEKGYRLLNYVWRNGHDYYGEFAFNYLVALRFLGEAGVDINKLSIPELERLGKAINQNITKGDNQ